MRPWIAGAATTFSLLHPKTIGQEIGRWLEGRLTAKFLVAISTLRFSVAVVAQQNSWTQEYPSVGPARNAEINIRGCVSGEKRYTFMQASTGEIFDLTGIRLSKAAQRAGLLFCMVGTQSSKEGDLGEVRPRGQSFRLRRTGQLC